MMSRKVTLSKKRFSVIKVGRIVPCDGKHKGPDFIIGGRSIVVRSGLSVVDAFIAGAKAADSINGRRAKKS
jgi:hypothetical protein